MFTVFQVDEHTFKVCSILGMSDSEPEDPDKGRNYFVKASIGEGEYYCQRCKFERDDIVCCHILKVMDMNAMTRMPRHFIRRRWIGTLMTRWRRRQHTQFWLCMTRDLSQPWKP